MIGPLYRTRGVQTPVKIHDRTSLRIVISDNEAIWFYTSQLYLNALAFWKLKSVENGLDVFSNSYFIQIYRAYPTWMSMKFFRMIKVQGLLLEKTVPHDAYLSLFAQTTSIFHHCPVSHRDGHSVYPSYRRSHRYTSRFYPPPPPQPQGRPVLTLSMAPWKCYIYMWDWTVRLQDTAVGPLHARLHVVTLHVIT